MEFEIKHKVKGNKIKVSYTTDENLIDLIRSVIFSHGLTKEEIFKDTRKNKEQQQ